MTLCNLHILINKLRFISRFWFQSQEFGLHLRSSSLRRKSVHEDFIDSAQKMLSKIDLCQIAECEKTDKVNLLFIEVYLSKT